MEKAGQAQKITTVNLLCSLRAGAIPNGPRGRALLYRGVLSLLNVVRRYSAMHNRHRINRRIRRGARIPVRVTVPPLLPKRSKRSQLIRVNQRYLLT